MIIKNDPTIKLPLSGSIRVRDFDKEARGKTRCAAMCSVLQPLIPLLLDNPQKTRLTMEVKEIAKELSDFVVEYSFQEDK